MSEWIVPKRHPGSGGAAEQDHAGAQYNLGVCYYMGHGVDADKTEARRWIAAAAEKGNADAVRALRLFD